MPVTVVNLDGGLGNFIAGTGIVAPGEYSQALAAHLGQSEDTFSRYLYSLADYSEVTELGLDSAEVRQVARWCREATKIAPDAVVAIVAPDEAVFGMARMYALWAGDSAWETKVHRSRADAAAWIRRRVQEIHGAVDIRFETD